MKNKSLIVLLFSFFCIQSTYCSEKSLKQRITEIDASIRAIKYDLEKKAQEEAMHSSTKDTLTKISESLRLTATQNASLVSELQKTREELIKTNDKLKETRYALDQLTTAAINPILSALQDPYAFSEAHKKILDPTTPPDDLAEAGIYAISEITTILNHSDKKRLQAEQWGKIGARIESRSTATIIREYYSTNQCAIPAGRIVRSGANPLRNMQ